MPFSSEMKKASAGSTAMTRYPLKNCCPASLHNRKPRLRRRRNSSRSMLEDGAELHCEEIIRAAADRQISRRTVNEAKKNISGIVTRKAGARWLWSMENEDCNIAEVSLKEG